jgi:uncharacterized lipoprotein YddW (UPF0748 family)
MLRLTAFLAAALMACAAAGVSAHATAPEVRGTWLTTTANDALRTPTDTAESMRRLKDIGMNTVYVEAWKNGYTQFPSAALAKVIGVDTVPGQAPRDLLQESLIEAHRNGLIYVAWFEYGFMAAHKDTMNHLRRDRPDWLSRDVHGSEVAPNGFVWLNPLHPGARALLRELILEAVDRYDIDGIQLDDRIVWPHVTMGYDDYTRRIYAQEHGGRQPPRDHLDPAWMAWRAAKVEAFARELVQALHGRKPRLLVSLSPAVTPWAWEHYLADWPRWRGWDEFIPQAYRFSYEAFDKTWRQQVLAVRRDGLPRQKLVAGIRIVGDGADSSWEQLQRSIALTRELGGDGHVLWFSRGVLDLYASELTKLYARSGPAVSPHFEASWRSQSLPLVRTDRKRGAFVVWRLPARPGGRFRLIGQDGSGWTYIGAVPARASTVSVARRYGAVEMVPDRRREMALPRSAY